MILRKPLEGADYLADLARGLLPTCVGVAVLDPREKYTGLRPEEKPPMASMIASRRLEYTAGRIAAHGAMGAIGVFRKPVISGPDRAPIWPKNVVGSISHSNKHCLAVAAHNRDILSVGVDLEPDEDLDSCLVAEICVPEEISWLKRQPASDQGRLARLIFSAKESTYKCLYPLTQSLIGFERLNINLEFNQMRFTATVSKAIGAFEIGYRLTGRIYFGDGLILTTLALSNTLPAKIWE